MSTVTVRVCVPAGVMLDVEVDEEKMNPFDDKPGELGPSLAWERAEAIERLAIKRAIMKRWREMSCDANDFPNAPILAAHGVVMTQGADDGALMIYLDEDWRANIDVAGVV